jgi:hypothetical protein
MTTFSRHSEARPNPSPPGCWFCCCGPCRFPTGFWQSSTTRPAAPIVKQAGKTLRIIVDGGYVKAPFLKRALRAAGTVIGRLRKDAALRHLPRALRRGQRRGPGRPPKYGQNKISLAKRAAHRQGWEVVECTVYGQTVSKLYKTFRVRPDRMKGRLSWLTILSSGFLRARPMLTWIRANCR